MSDICLIAALGRDRAIGRAGALPWQLPDDLKRFKALTLGKPVLMGRKTAESIGRELPGRRNLILTRRDELPFTGADTQRIESIAEALRLGDDSDVMVIGGGEIYRQTLALATRLYLTEVDATCADADAFFPPINPADWAEAAREHHAADARHAFAFDFVDYVCRTGSTV